MGVEILPPPTQEFAVGNVSGPNPYAAGGFVIDLTGSFASVDWIELIVTTVGPNLPPVHIEYALDTPTAGKVTVKLMRDRFDRATLTIGNVSGQPGGVTVAAASGVLVTAAGGHTHTTDGGHAGHGVVSTVANALTVDAVGGVGTAQQTAHQHATSAGAHTHDAIANHQHTDNNLYEHQHVTTQTQTDLASVEIGAVNLSGTTWRFLAKGA